jgi:hypothetical protein
MQRLVWGLTYSAMRTSICKVYYMVFELFRGMGKYTMFLCIVLTLACCFVLTESTNAQQATIHLNSGEIVHGELLAIGSALISLNTEDGYRVVRRSDIRYQLISAPKNLRKSKQDRPKMTLEPLSKKFITEMGAGLTFGNPFALSFRITEWRNYGNRFQVGLGASWQFYRYSMFTLNGNARLLFGKSKYVKPFLETGFDLSYYQYVNGLNFRRELGSSFVPAGYEAEFSPIKQVRFGPGLYIDTGLGVGFLGKLVFNATWYELRENPNSTFLIEGQYFFGSATLSGSFIF